MPNALGEMTFEEVISELQQLNPKAEITVNQHYDGIISNRPAHKLFLTRGFYVTRNGNISNYGNTESGIYLSLGVTVRNAEMVQAKLSKLNFFDKMKCKLFTRKAQVSVAEEQHNREM